MEAVGDFFKKAAEGMGTGLFTVVQKAGTGIGEGIATGCEKLFELPGPKHVADGAKFLYAEVIPYPLQRILGNPQAGLKNRDGDKL